MSANFCLLIPVKIFQIEKRFSENLRSWSIDYPEVIGEYSLCSLSEFVSRSDVNLDLPENWRERYAVLDRGFDCPSPNFLRALLVRLAEIYPYGEVGLLKYWLDTRKRFPPISIGSIEGNLPGLSLAEFPLDKLYFFPLQKYREPS